MSLETNIALFRDVVEIESTGAVDRLDAVMAEDYVHHDPNMPPKLQRGRDGYKQIIVMLHTAFPDLHGTIEQLFTDGDRVVGQWTYRGTHQGDLMGVAPTGRPVTITGIQVLRIDGGKVVEGWVSFDALGMLQQLGVFPMPEPATR